MGAFFGFILLLILLLAALVFGARNHSSIESRIRKLGLAFALGAGVYLPDEFRRWLLADNNAEKYHSISEALEAWRTNLGGDASVKEAARAQKEYDDILHWLEKKKS